MSATFLPFNFKPTATTTFAAESYSYTVPTGHFAIISYSLSATSYTFPGSNDNEKKGTVQSNSSSGIIYLEAGDVMTRATSAPSGTSSSVANYSNTCYCTLSVNSNLIANAYAKAASACSGTVGHIYGGTANVEAFIAEYALP